MTDLHTHILPGMDDGARDLSTALALLEQEARQNVHNVALTNHYHCEAETVDDFLGRRERAFSELRAAAPADICLKQGCEVFFSPMLTAVDAAALCLEGTNYLLLELPILQKPAFLREVLLHLRSLGLVPLIAHVERYAYVRRDPTLLADWIDLGALIQVSSGSLTGRDGAFVRKLIKWGLVHVLASDAHSVSYRPADLKPGLDAVSRSLGAEKARELERNAGLIFSGEQVPDTLVHRPRRLLGLWV